MIVMNGVGGSVLQHLEERAPRLSAEGRYYASCRDLAELQAWQQRLRTFINVCELAFAQSAAALSELDREDQLCDLSPIQALRYDCKMASSAASAAVSIGEQWESLPKSRAAVAGGRIGIAHLKLLAETAEFVGAGFDETALLKQAEKPGKLLTVFAKDCMRARYEA